MRQPNGRGRQDEARLARQRCSTDDRCQFGTCLDRERTLAGVRDSNFMQPASAGKLDGMVEMASGRWRGSSNPAPPQAITRSTGAFDSTAPKIVAKATS